jgi:putative transposase
MYQYCKYHVIGTPKYLKKGIYGDIRRYLGDTLRELALQKESKILEGHLRGDHLHMLVLIWFDFCQLAYFDKSWYTFFSATQQKSIHIQF